MRIVGRPRLTLTQVIRAVEVHSLTLPDPVDPRFIKDIIPALYEAGRHYGIDPVGLIAQSALETGWGRYKGNAKWWFRNTCGLKVLDTTSMKELLASLPVTVISLEPETVTDFTAKVVVHDDSSLLHQVFWSWILGALAHAQHVCAYAGHDLPEGEPVLSPRSVHIKNKRLENWSEFGNGNWAPRVGYGDDIERIMQTLINAAPA